MPTKNYVRQRVRLSVQQLWLLAELNVYDWSLLESKQDVVTQPWLQHTQKLRSYCRLGPTQTEAEFRQLAKDGALPPGLPKYPYEKYKNNGWISWGDFRVG